MCYIARMARTVIVSRANVLQRGLFARIARQFGVDPSHVSRVAYGYRKNKKISKALQAELRKLLATAQKSIRKPTRK